GCEVVVESVVVHCVFFFQAEDGIRDWSVTGVQTCALPILLQRIPERLAARCASLHPSQRSRAASRQAGALTAMPPISPTVALRKIGRASCRERVEMAGEAVALKSKEERGGW